MAEYRIAIVVDANNRVALQAFDETTQKVEELDLGLGKLGEKTVDAGGKAEEAGGKWSKAGALIGGAVVAVTTAIVGMTAKAIAGADDMGKLAERLGVSTEYLSGMGYAAESSGANLQLLSGGIESLSTNLSKAAGGSAEQARLFAQMGISVRDAEGNVRGMEDVLGEVADRFKSYEDGPAKAALATKLFGSAGSELIPMLNEGSEGLAEMRAKAQELGLVIGGETADQAAAFKDNLADLKAMAMGFFNTIAEQVLPILVDLSRMWVESGKDAADSATKSEAIVSVFKFIVATGFLVKNTIESIIAIIKGLVQTVVSVGEVAGAGLSRIGEAVVSYAKMDYAGAMLSIKAGVQDMVTVAQTEAPKLAATWAGTGATIKQQILEVTDGFELLDSEMRQSAEGQKKAAEETRKSIPPLISAADASRAAAEARKADAAALKEWIDQAKTMQGVMAANDAADSERAQRARDLKTALEGVVASIRTESELLDLSTRDREIAVARLEAQVDVERLLADAKADGVDVTDDELQALAKLIPLLAEQLALKRQTKDVEDAIRAAGGLFGGEVTDAGEIIPYREITDLLAAAVRDGMTGGLPQFFSTLKRGLKEAFKDAGSALQSATGIFNLAADIKEANRNNPDGWMRVLTDSLAQSNIPIVSQVAQAVNALDRLAGGRLLGTAWEADSSGVNVNLGAGGFGGTSTTTEVRQRSFFRGRQWRTDTDPLDSGLQQQLRELFRAIQQAMTDGVRQLGVDLPELITGTFREVRDKNGDIKEQFSTVNGVRYNEDLQAFGRRLMAENLIAVVGQAAAEASGIAERWRSSAETLLDGAQTLLLAQRDITDGIGLLGDEGGLGDVIDLIEDLQAGGETLQAAYQRVAGSTRLFDEALKLAGVSLDLTREETVRFATDIAEAAGGLERATSLWQRYFATFYTDGERATRTLQGATERRDEQAAALGIDPNIGMTEFRELFEARLPSLTAEQIADWLELADAMADVDQATRQLAEAQTNYREFIIGLQDEIDALDGSEFNREMSRIRQETAAAVANANDLARAAGRQGASTRELALIHRWAARQIEEAISALKENINSLMEELGYGTLNAIDQQIAALEGRYNGLTNGALNGIDQVQAANDNLYQSQVDALQALRESLDDTLLGDLSPLAYEDQVAEARRQLSELADQAAAGDVDAARRFTQLRQQFLRLVREGEASGQDYSDQYAFAQALAERILQFSPQQTGGPNTVSLVPSPELEALYRQRDELLANQEAERRAGLAQELAQNLVDLARVSGETVFAVAERLGVNLGQFVSDLGGQLTELDAAAVRGLGGIANTLEVELSDLAGALGIELGEITDANSLLNDALEESILALPADLAGQLLPALRELETATSPEEVEAALRRLTDLTDALPDNFRLQLAPYLDGVDPFTADQLSELDHLTAVADNTAETVEVLDEILAEIAGPDAGTPAGSDAPAGGQFDLAPPPGPDAAPPVVDVQALLEELREMRAELERLQEAVGAGAARTSDAVAGAQTAGSDRVAQAIGELATALRSEGRTVAA